MSSNVKVYGAIYSAESCSYDPVRNLIIVPNRSVGQDVQTNNGSVSLEPSRGGSVRRSFPTSGERPRRGASGRQIAVDQE